MQVDEQESKLTSLTLENAGMFGENAELRKETRRLQEIASGHANDNLKLSEEVCTRASANAKTRTVPCL